MINTELLLNPTKEQQKASGMEFKVSKSGRPCNTDDKSLTPATLIDTKKYGKQTLEWILMVCPREHMRCQTPFRPDSKSWNAYINFTEGGDVFLYDNGTHIIYFLSPDVASAFKATGVVGGKGGVKGADAAAGIEIMDHFREIKKI